MARVTSTLGRATYVGARRRSLRLVNPNTAARSAFESEDASRASRSDPASILWQASLRSCDCQESFQACSAHKFRVQLGKQGLRRHRCGRDRRETCQSSPDHKSRLQRTHRRHSPQLARIKLLEKLSVSADSRICPLKTLPDMFFRNRWQPITIGDHEGIHPVFSSS